MDPNLSLLFIKNLNELCGLEHDNLIYSLLPSIDVNQSFVNGTYNMSLKDIPLFIDAGVQVFTNKKTNISKNSPYYLRVKEEKENLFNILAKSKRLLGLKEIKVGEDKKSAALAAVSSVYFNTFFTPIPFFLPNTSLFSGHWDFWDEVNYLEFIKKVHQKEMIEALSERLLKGDGWKMDFKPNDFPEIIKRRLIKEDAFNKKLVADSMIKAIIIRMGELGKPYINYEIIDYAIRNFFTYLAIDRYLRVDREILFLRKFEKRLKDITCK